MKCDLCDNTVETLYEGWFRVKCPLTGRAMINQLHRVCKECARHSIAYEANGEKVFDLAEDLEWSYQI